MNKADIDAIREKLMLKVLSYSDYIDLALDKLPDALSEIDRLTAENERLKKTLDKAVEDLRANAACRVCKHRSGGVTSPTPPRPCINFSEWQWRGFTADTQK
jgi:hypothetical protein